MEFTEFIRNKPTLYGQITVRDKSKVGSFKPVWNSFSNSLQYAYYSPKGRKAAGGFTLRRAYYLFITGRLTLNPANGNPDNYL